MEKIFFRFYDRLSNRQLKIAMALYAILLPVLIFGVSALTKNIELRFSVIILGVSIIGGSFYAWLLKKFLLTQKSHSYGLLRIASYIMLFAMIVGPIFCYVMAKYYQAQLI